MTPAGTSSDLARPATGPTRVLEAGRRLSDSFVWQLQRRFYAERGLAAWRDNVVPHYVTNNPLLAHAYARVILGFLRDCSSVGASPRLDPSQPIYILELGTGAGRLAFHLARLLGPLLRSARLGALRFRYVATDFCEGNLRELQAHPQLAPLIADGTLDLACLDLERDEPLLLRSSGETLRPGSLVNPMIVVANYVFDGLPQDCFYIQDGRLHDCLVTVSAPIDHPDLDDPALLGCLTLSYERRPLVGAPYGDGALDSILAEYERRLVDTAVLFPRVALTALRRLGAWAGGRMLVLAADKGSAREDTLLNQPEPGLVVHGSFSLSVNFHAIARAFRSAGGEALVVPQLSGSLEICAFIGGAMPDGLDETRMAFDDAIVHAGPDDFFALHRSLGTPVDEWSLRDVLAFLRWSRWDPGVLPSMVSALRHLAPTVPRAWQHELLRATRQIWRNYYAVCESWDLAFELGGLLYDMGMWAEAGEFFERSLAARGPSGAVLFNLAMCHYHLRRLDTALQRVAEALALDPGNGGARTMQLRIAAELAW
jgi:hypothetical protein